MDQAVVFEHPHAVVREQAWSCREMGCGWVGASPNHVRGSVLIAAEQRGIPVKKFTKAMRDLQSSGDLILVSDDTMEVVF